MKAEDLAKLLSLPSDSQEIINCLNCYGVNISPKLKKNETDTYTQIQKNGIAFLFEDEAYYKELKYQDIGDGPLLLTAIFLYGSDDDEYSAFTGGLPKGLFFSDGREEACNKLGQSADWDEDILSEYWDIQGFRYFVNYSDDLRSIRNIQIGLIPQD